MSFTYTRKFDTMATDAFGRLRVSEPFTLFESAHRYGDNGKVSVANSAGGTFFWNSNTGTIDCTVTTANNAYVYRETSLVFPYQPGKSLQSLITFCMNPAKAGLRQRAGYFGTQNGFFLERSDDVYFVERSSVTGTTADNKVAQANWNVDRLDGTGPSCITLNLDDPQILFIDIEWLGSGTVRMGFVINGEFILCHRFNHANIDTAFKGAYIQTASLPLRIEIENTADTASSSMYRQICATVISEGGFEGRGKIRSVGIDPFTANSKTLTTSGTYYPIVAIRLKDSRKDGIVFPRSVQFLGLTNNTTYRWKIYTGVTLTNPTWVSAGTDSSIEYDISATGMTGGTEIRSDYINVSSGAGAAVSQIDPSDIFRYQLERNPFAASNNGIIYCLAATGAGAGDKAVGSVQWEEIT